MWRHINHQHVRGRWSYASCCAENQHWQFVFPQHENWHNHHLHLQQSCRHSKETLQLVSRWSHVCKRFSPPAARQDYWVCRRRRKLNFYIHGGSSDTCWSRADQLCVHESSIKVNILNSQCPILSMFDKRLHILPLTWTLIYLLEMIFYSKFFIQA